MRKFKKLAVLCLSTLMAFSSTACAFLPLPIGSESSTSSSSESSSEHTHKTVHRTGIASTCLKGGKLEHWECVGCGSLFADEDCTEEITLTDVNLPTADHDLKKHDRVEPTLSEDGNREYYTCNDCGKYFADEKGKSEISEKDISLKSDAHVVDFMINIPEDRDPVILQLADPQIIDSSTMRTPDRLSAAKIEAWGPDSREERCYKYIRELVEDTSPDLILVSGDVIYGSFDDDGHLLLDFIRFMESLNVYWAPVMGNHDIESNMGADWMCMQYEKANKCLFKQGDISGNGNFTIGIKQGDDLKRVIMNMDTNGCTGASDASKNNGQTVTTTNNSYNISYGAYGLQKDQVEWFQKTIAAIKKVDADVKITFHFHIAMNYFATAFNNAYKHLNGDPVAQVEAEQNVVTARNRILYPERLKGHKEGDFGALQWLWQFTPDFWDRERINGKGKEDEIYRAIKAVGTDSILVGHYHSNSVSIVYDGIRFQYGQKCSTYDTTQVISDSGVISSNDILPDTKGTPLVGGTVMPMDKETGEFLTPYIQFCTGAGKEIDWDKYKNTIG